MKIRVRSLETKETIKIEAPSSSTLCDLKSLIAGRLSSPVTSLHLSLNRKDEFGGDDDDSKVTVESLGLISGDLVFCTTDPIAFSSSVGERRDLVDGEKKGKEVVESVDVEMVDSSGESFPKGGAISESKGTAFSLSVPNFVKSVVQAEAGAIATVDDLEILVTAVHAVLVDSGFVICGGNGGSCRLLEGRAIRKGAAILVHYTLPGLENGYLFPTVCVRFTQIGNYASVYGSLIENSDVYRCTLSLLASKLTTGRVELWNTVKDELSLPLLVDLSEKYGTPSPPCFARLPMELKIKILELVPGEDLARIGCTNKEMKLLSSNDELWGKKFIEEFHLSDWKGLFGMRWKDKFATCWKKNKVKKDHIIRGNPPSKFGFRQYWRRPVPFGAAQLGYNEERHHCIGREVSPFSHFTRLL